MYERDSRMDGRNRTGLSGLMTTTHTPRTVPSIAVLGGTGRTGGRVAGRLRDRGIDVHIGSRSVTPAFHWEHPETWEPVLSGCTAAYVAYTPEITHPGAVEAVAALAESARRCGLRQLVLLSGRGEEQAERAEEAVRAAGVPTAVIRSAVFAQNFSEHFLHDPVLAGVIELPAGDVAEPFIDIDDLADVATHLLLATEPADVTLELTGPELLTFADVAEELSVAVGRPVTYRAISVHEFVEGSVEAGMPREDAEDLGVVFAQIFDGRNAYVTTAVEQILGRPAGDFAAYVRRAASSGAWVSPGEPVRP
ncbi:Rossmann-fold NAD(P)-binding domain-containing protein [Mariniluteicoccus flavus]